MTKETPNLEDTLKGEGAGDTDKIIDALTSKLLDQDGVVSSDTQEIDKLIEESISATKEAGEKREAGVKARVKRLREERRETGRERITQAQEASRGFATNRALIKDIKEQTDKSLKDLDQREQEMLAAGATEDAAAIRQLKLSQIQFSQQAQQNAFQNILSVAGLQIQQSREERMQEAQDFQQENAMNAIALEFGVSIGEDDTYADVIDKAIPLASEDRKFALKKRKRELDKLDAEIAKLNRGGMLSLGDDTLTTLADAAIDNPDIQSAVIETMLSNNDMKGVAALAEKMEERSQPRKYTEDELIENAVAFKESGDSLEEALEKAEEDAFVTNTEDYKEAIRELYGRTGTIEEGGRPITEKGREQRREEKIKNSAERARSTISDILSKKSVDFSDRGEIRKILGGGRGLMNELNIGRDEKVALRNMAAGLTLTEDDLELLRNIVSG